MNFSDRTRQARLQSDLYRDSYRRILRVLAVLSCIAAALALAISWVLVFHPAPDTAWAAILDGQVIPMPPGKQG